MPGKAGMYALNIYKSPKDVSLANFGSYARACKRAEVKEDSGFRIPAEGTESCAARERGRMRSRRMHLYLFSANKRLPQGRKTTESQAKSKRSKLVNQFNFPRRGSPPHHAPVLGAVKFFEQITDSPGQILSMNDSSHELLKFYFSCFVWRIHRGRAASKSIFACARLV